MAEFLVTIDSQTSTVVIDDASEQVLVDGIAAEIEPAGTDRWMVRMEGTTIPVTARRIQGGAEAVVRGLRVEAAVETPRERLVRTLSRSSGGAGRKQDICAPMPAMLVRFDVAPGDAVEAGDPLLVLEAMKMENELRAPHAGTVREILVAVGAAVEKGTRLLVLE
jgi:biotin carboxyl carrier protein